MGKSFLIQGLLNYKLGGFVIVVPSVLDKILKLQSPVHEAMGHELKLALLNIARCMM